MIWKITRILLIPASHSPWGHPSGCSLCSSILCTQGFQLKTSPHHCYSVSEPGLSPQPIPQQKIRNLGQVQQSLAPACSNPWPLWFCHALRGYPLILTSVINRFVRPLLRNTSALIRNPCKACVYPCSERKLCCIAVVTKVQMNPAFSWGGNPLSCSLSPPRVLCLSLPPSHKAFPQPSSSGHLLSLQERKAAVQRTSQIIKYQILSLSIKSELGRKTCHGKAFLGGKRKERAEAQTPPGELGWAHTAAPARNHHTKVGQFLRTGVRRPAGLSSSRKGIEIYINQLLIT